MTASATDSVRSKGETRVSDKKGSQLPLSLPGITKSQLQPKKLTLDFMSRAYSYQPSDEFVQAVPSLILPTRWEHLQPQIEKKNVSIRTIIQPIPRAMNVIREIIEYLKTTGGCQVLIMRADTGSGKTTFLNTLPHYIQDVTFYIETIDLQTHSESEFGEELWDIKTSLEGINLIILEGREKPESIDDKYIQVVLAHINRFARNRRVPILFVIPTIDEQVARNWCAHGSKIGDLIPEQRLYEGSRWYNYPSVDQVQYVEIAEGTVKALNPPHVLTDFGVSPDEVENWAKTAHTIGAFIEILASEASARRRRARIPLRGPREHVWVAYSSPDLRHYDHTFLVIDGLVQDEKLKASPNKLVPHSTDNTLAAFWRQGKEWEKLVATINFLDIRLVNLPITTVVTAALVYGDESLLQSFKDAQLNDYRESIPDEMRVQVSDWSQQLSARRLQTKNARDSMERANLFRLLRGMPAEPQKGGVPESPKLLAQYLHLRKKANERELHYYLGCTLNDLLQYHQFPGFIGIETEEPLIQGESSPVPDITVHTKTDVYALELHFRKQQIASSQVARYALRNVIEKYMKGLSHLRSQLAIMT